MPSVTNLARIARLGTLPETRRAIMAGARSGHLREVAWMASHDRRALVRGLRDPSTIRTIVRAAVRHPATRELGSVSLMFMPGRYLPLGWTAAWAARRFLRRRADPPS